MPVSKERIQPEIIRDISQRSAEKMPLPRSVESWMEKWEKDPQQSTVIDDQGQTVLKPAKMSDDDQVKLTISKRGLSRGFSKSVEDAGRWLVESLFRLIKIKKGKVKFSKEDE